MSKMDFKSAAESLMPQQRERLQLHLCSVCRAIGENYGVKARSIFRYDIVVLSILLHAVYDEQGFLCKGKCLKHPTKSQRFYQSEISDYAAAMNIAVSFIGAKGGRSIKSKLQKQLLQKPFVRIKKRFPLQCAAAHKAILQNDTCDNYAEMCGEMFSPFDDALSDDLKNFGEAFGRLRYADKHMASDADKKLYITELEAALQHFSIRPADADLLKAFLFR